jgi:hypothetical protein
MFFSVNSIVVSNIPTRTILTHFSSATAAGATFMIVSNRNLKEKIFLFKKENGEKFFW